MPWPPRWLFISNRLAIDFVHTGGKGFRARWERWHVPADLAEWVRECPQLRLSASVTERDLELAWELREAIWEAAQCSLRGEPIPTAAALTIQRAAAGPDLVPALERCTRTWASGALGEQVLSTVARDAIELFGTPVKDRLRKCKRHNCYLLFVDTSRPGKRAWCTMRRCGNLDKIARYRASQRTPSEARERQT